MPLKITGPDAWDFGDAPAQLIKCASRGLHGRDRRVLEKRAGSEFTERASQVKLAQGEIPVHLIAMGAREMFGPNRNGDAFARDVLQKYAHTFADHARFYRHHRNKDPQRSYGTVKLAYFNPDMGRVELLVGLNGDSEAAEKNGGLVADEELSILESGRDLPVSMACHVPHDVCDACGNQARNRSEYCKSAEEGGKCSLFGCSTGLTKVSADGRIQFVHNPEPRFFDISRVGRNADPIAWGAVADYLQKAASTTTHVPGGAELAEQYHLVPPLSLTLQQTTDPYTARCLKLAYQLAEIEDELTKTQPDDPRQAALALAFCPEVQPPVDLTPLGKVGSDTFAAGMQALASQQVLLTPQDFVRLFTGSDVEKSAAMAEQMRDALPGTFNRLLGSTDLWHTSLAHNPFRPSRNLASATLRQWAEKCAATRSVDPQRVQLRVSLAAIRHIPNPVMTKTATLHAGEASQLASMYSLYKLAFLAAQDEELPLTRELAVRQNYIC